MMPALDDKIIDRLRAARRVAMLTGAGISAESNIPTFRDAQTGYWAKFNPYELASPAGFAADPQQVWDWYRHRRLLVRDAQPNPGHLAVAQMESIWPEFTLITQNVDGLHGRAGSTNMLLLHGNLQQVRCSSDDQHPRRDWPAAWDVAGDAIPLCACGAMLRPAVVWFGEMLDPPTLHRAEAAAANSEVFFSVGTSATVQPAALLPLIAKRNGATVIEINMEPTTLSPLAAVVLLGSAAAILPEVVRQVRG